MGEGADTVTVVSGAGSGRGGRNRGRRRNNNSNSNNNNTSNSKRNKSQQQQPSKHGPSGGAVGGGGGGGSSRGGKQAAFSGTAGGGSAPPPPQVKITIRNIQNASKFGSVKLILNELVEKLMEACVEKKANKQYTIALDRSAVQTLIQEEEVVNAYIAKEKARMEAERADDENNGNGDGTGGADGNEHEGNAAIVDTEDVSNELGKDHADESESKEPKLDLIVAPKPPTTLPIITARPLYVIPPRKTRRRGERSGTIYLLLTGPKIESIKNERSFANKHDPVVASTASQNQHVKRGEEISSGIVPQHVSSEHESPGDDRNAVTLRAKVTPSTSNVDYPRQLAKGRLLLSNAMGALQQLAADDSKAQEFFAGCIVEQSMNAKSWRSGSIRPDRREGTIEATSDYKQWLDSLEKQKEELQARPKPTPGGGAVGVGGDNLEDGQVIAALVQHLRAKRLEMKSKNASKKKEENKSKAKKDGKKSRRGGGGGGNVGGGKSEMELKKVKKKKKPVGKKKGTKASVVAPTGLLKPKT